MTGAAEDEGETEQLGQHVGGQQLLRPWKATRQ